MQSLGVRLAAAASLLVMAATAQAPTFQPVGNMRQLMIDIIYPTSDALFYVDRDPPKNEHEWSLLRAQALMLAESGNLIMMEGRARSGELDQIFKDHDRPRHDGLQSGAGQKSGRHSRAQ